MKKEVRKRERRKWNNGVCDDACSEMGSRVYNTIYNQPKKKKNNMLKKRKLRKKMERGNWDDQIDTIKTVIYLFFLDFWMKFKEQSF